MKPLLIFFLILTSSLCLAEIFKWKDANGKVHFSDVKPESQPYEEKKVVVPTMSNRGEEHRNERLDNDIKALETRREQFYKTQVVNLNLDAKKKAYCEDVRNSITQNKKTTTGILQEEEHKAALFQLLVKEAKNCF